MWNNHTQTRQPDPSPHAGQQLGHTLLWDDIPFFHQYLLQVSFYSLHSQILVIVSKIVVIWVYYWLQNLILISLHQDCLQ